jgi:hypothetical protein
VPALITTGQYDEITLDCHQTIMEAVAGSQLLIFEGCSHCTMNEKRSALSLPDVARKLIHHVPVGRLPRRSLAPGRLKLADAFRHSDASANDVV